MKTNCVLSFLLSATGCLTRAWAETPGSSPSSSSSCKTDISTTPQPVLCGVDAEEFENLCLATLVGGYEESECLSKALAELLANISPPATNTYANGSTYQPVICTATGEEGAVTSQEVFQNIKAAELTGDYDDVILQCTCYELDAIVYILSLIFGEENCEYYTNPVGPSGNDAQVWYTCHNPLDTGTNGTDTRQILGARLVANGILEYDAIPDYLILDLNPANQPSTVGASLSTSIAIRFRNDCTDHERTEAFLGLYN